MFDRRNCAKALTGREFSLVGKKISWVNISATLEKLLRGSSSTKQITEMRETRVGGPMNGEVVEQYRSSLISTAPNSSRVSTAVVDKTVGLECVATESVAGLVADVAPGEETNDGEETGETMEEAGSPAEIVEV